MAHYAWSDIVHGEEGETVEYGDSVSQSDLGVSDEDWADLVESGAVREEEPPELPEGYSGSVADFEKEQAEAEAKLAEAQAVLDEGKEEKKESKAPASRASSEKK